MLRVFGQSGGEVFELAGKILMDKQYTHGDTVCYEAAVSVAVTRVMSSLKSV
jgi:hypothetical protein